MKKGEREEKISKPRIYDDETLEKMKKYTQVSYQTPKQLFTKYKKNGQPR